jgi:hypothetical protein
MRRIECYVFREWYCNTFAETSVGNLKQSSNGLNTHSRLKTAANIVSELPGRTSPHAD